MLQDKHRPQRWTEVAGQDAAIARIGESLLKRGWGGRAWWIVGKSGTGCTTIARLLAQEKADEKAVLSVQAGLLDADAVHRMKRESREKPRAYIIDGPENMRKGLQELLNVLSRPPQYVCIVFTMDPDGEKKFLASGGTARDVAASCRRIELAVDEALEEAFARRAKKIADREGLGGGKALSAYKALAWDCHYNLRRMLNRIEAGEMQA